MRELKTLWVRTLQEIFCDWTKESVSRVVAECLREFRTCAERTEEDR
jgi:hypothetical protein